MLIRRNPYDDPEHYETCDGTYDSDGYCWCDYHDEDLYDREINRRIDSQRDK